MKLKPSKDIFLKSLVLLPFIFAQSILFGQTKDFTWDNLDKLISAIKAPVFPDHTYNIVDFGAVPNSLTPATKAIQAAIDSCNQHGGGEVLVPKGTFHTGALRLKSNVNLHLSEGSVLKFSTNPNDYLPVVLTRWEGVDCYNYSPLIYAYQQQNIAITGKGILDGQASDSTWWAWKGGSWLGQNGDTKNQLNPDGRAMLMKFEENNTPVKQRIMGAGHYLRPPFVELYQCKNILLEGFTIHNAPFWQLHPLLSQNITIRGIHAESRGPNNDGCDPESCSDVLIENCYFSTGDDCIAIKSGRNNDGRRWNIPSQNIVIRNCSMNDGHGGVVIGSEVSGGCRNVFVYDCKMNSPELDRAIRIKTNTLRGGVIENVYVKNIEVGQVREAILKINCMYETNSDKGDHIPIIRNIHLSNITSKKSQYPLYLIGLRNHDAVENIYVSNSRFNGVSKACKITGVKNLRINNVYVNGNPLKIN